MLRRSVENWCFHAEDLMQFRRRCRVLHVDLLLREDIGRRAKGCQRSFVEARQDQLFLAWVGVDVAHREDARNVGFELFGVDHFQLLALDIQTPFGDRAQFWRQTEKHQQHVKRQAASNAVGTGDLDLGQFAVLGFKTGSLPNQELHFVLFAQFLHLGYRCRRRAEFFATVQQHDGFSLADEVQRPVQRGVTAAADDNVLAFKLCRILDAIEQLRAVEGFDTVNLQGARLERTHAGSDEDGLGDELGACGCFEVETAVFALLHDGDFLTQMESRIKRFDLLEQVVGQFLACAHRYGRNVVDRLVRIQFDALAADIGERVDNVRLDFQQAQLKYLEQADRACADDDGIGFDRRCFAGVSGRNLEVVHKKIQFPFQLRGVSRLNWLSAKAGLRGMALVPVRSRSWLYG